MVFLRHTVANQAVARGVARSRMPKMLGRGYPTMTLRYARIGNRDIEATAERIGGVIKEAMAGG